MAARRIERRHQPQLEALESRLALSTAWAPPPGLDAMALADVNGDRVVDVVTASHQGGHSLITIYSGYGQADSTSPTDYVPRILATIRDPLGSKAGALTIASGDFDGDGLSELAVASANRGSKVATFKFEVDGSQPTNATVKPVTLAPKFTPSGLNGACGLSLASGDLDGDGLDELVASPGGPGGRQIDVLGFDTGSFALSRTIALPKGMGSNLEIDAGDLDGDGKVDLAAVNGGGRLAEYDGASGSWRRSTLPLGRGVSNANVAIVENEGSAGAVVVTGQNAQQQPQAALVPVRGPVARFTLPTSPGAGALVPLGGGYVYPQSSIVNPTSAFPTSNGPVTPTVLFGSTGGSNWVVQGFGADNKPNPADTFVESATQFIPLFDPTKGPSTSGDGIEGIAPLVAYDLPTYQSPYQIDLTGAPASAFEGLLPTAPYSNNSDGAWGPATPANTPPVVPAGQGSEWLRQRLMAAYAAMIGVDYQHHHDPRWLPEQGGAWNVTGTVGYQSQGVDCTNFTAYAYKNALGISMDSATGPQATIGLVPNPPITIPDAIKDQVELKVIDHWTSYNDLVSQLQPGDILYIYGNPKDPSQATHAITWLGSFGKDANGKDRYLIIDATGIQPPHVDSNGRVVAEGVHIRPFGEPGSLNSWYYDNLGHALRIIKD